MKIVDNLDFLNMVADILNLVFTILFSVCIAFSIMCILVVGIIYLKKIYSLRICIHLTWCIYCLIMVIGFLLGTVLSPVIVGMSEVCIYIDSYFTDAAYFDSHALIPAGNSRDIVRECVFGS